MAPGLGRRALAALGTLAFAFAAPSAASAQEEGRLNLLTWEGYTAPGLVDAFAARTGCAVNAVFVGADHDFTLRLAGGGYADFDLVSPSIDMTSVLVKLGVVEPVNTLWLNHWSEIPENFRRHPGVVADGAVWAVPFAWGAVGLLYRSDKVERPPSSFEALWDERYAGRISLWDDKAALYTAARLLFGRSVEVHDLSDAELSAAEQKLIAQKPLLRDYWSSAGELINLFAYGDVWLSDGWEIVARALEAEGLPVALVLPEENVTGWADAWQIVKDSPNRDCAYEWLNFVISPEGQCLVFAATGFAPVNPKAFARCPEAEHADGIDRLANLPRVELWREPARPGRYVEVWNAVKAAQ